MASRIPEKLAVAITFHYQEGRLKYLEEATSELPHLARSTHVWLITNTREARHHDEMRRALGSVELEIVTPTLLGHPYLLTWGHREIFKTLYENDPSYTHFLYLEDDLAFGRRNVEYWMAAREELRDFGLIPGFVRFEVGSDGVAYSSDIYRKSNVYDLARIYAHDSVYVNMRYPYQGMYLMDRELMGEFVDGVAFGPDFGPWRIREKAAQGLTFANVPEGCSSAIFVGFSHEGKVDSRALVHHLPNNYALNKDTKYGSLPIDEILSWSKWRVPLLWGEILKTISLRKPRIRKVLVRRIPEQPRRPELSLS